MDTSINQTGLYNLPTTNDSNTSGSTKVGTFRQATNDSPNPISILGTPGAVFKVELTNVTTAADITDVNLETLDGDAAGSATDYVIPSSGVYVFNMVGFEAASATTEYDFKVTAGANTTLRDTTMKTDDAAVSDSNTAANNVTNTFTQPKSDTFIKVVIEDTDLNSEFYHNQVFIGGPWWTQPGGTIPALVYTEELGPDLLVSVENGIAGTFVDDINHRSDIIPKVYIVHQRKAENWDVTDRMELEISLEIEFLKFGTEDTTITLNLTDVINYDPSSNEFTSTGTLGTVVTADFYGDGAVAETGTGWNITGGTGAEFAIKYTELNIQ